MWRLINIVALLPVILTTGCCNFYHKPTVHVVNHWTVPDKTIPNTDEKNLPYIAWWHDFNDETLNRLIDRGLKCNTSLNKSRGHIEAAEGELKKIRFQWLPNADVMFGYSRNPATGFPGVLAVFAPSYIINIFHQIQEQKKAFYELEEAKAEDDVIKLTVIAEIALSYFTYLAELERRTLLRILSNDLMQLATIASNVYKGGLSSFIDEQELYSEAKEIRGQQEVIENNIIVSRNAIRYLLNLIPGEIKTTLKFSDLNNHQLIPGSLPLTVLENRPDMKMAKNRLCASYEGIGLATSNLLPTITLDLIAGAVAGDSRYAWPTHGIYFNDELLKIPVFKMSVLGEIFKARGLNKVAYFNYIDTLQKALRDTTNALSAFDRLSNKFKETQDSQRYLSKSYELNRSLYKRGIQNYVDMLKAKIILDRTNIKLNQDKLQQLITIVKLYQELAGGYKCGA